MSDEDLTIIGRRIGYSDSIAEAFGITRADRRRHLYVQGKMGSGKSTLLISMIAQRHADKSSGRFPVRSIADGSYAASRSITDEGLAAAYPSRSCS